MNTEEGRRTEKQKAEHIPQNLAKVDEILWYNEHRGREMRDMNDILKDFLEELIDIILVCD